MKTPRIFIITLLFFSLFLIPVISAVEKTTYIRVKTIPEYKVSIQILDPTQVYLLLESFHKYASINGEVGVNYTGNLDTLKINIQVSKEGNIVYNEKFGEFETGRKLFFQLLSGNITSYYETEGILDSSIFQQNKSDTIINNSSQNNSNTSANSSASTSQNKSIFSLTGLSIFSQENILSKNFFYILIGLFVLAIIIFIVLKFNLIPSFPILSQPRQIKETKSTDFFARKNLEKELAQTQKELEKAKTEISRLRNEEKIKEIEKEIEQKKQEIEKLKK